jgi:hypothetical protein
MVIAGPATIWGAYVALQVLRIVHGLVWAVPVSRLIRPWRATGVFILLAAVALWLSALIGDLGRSSLVAALVAEVLFLLVTFGLWILLSWYMPRPAGSPWTALIPGAVLLAVGAQGTAHRDRVLGSPPCSPTRRRPMAPLG